MYTVCMFNLDKLNVLPFWCSPNQRLETHSCITALALLSHTYQWKQTALKGKGENELIWLAMNGESISQNPFCHSAELKKSMESSITIKVLHLHILWWPISTFNLLSVACAKMALQLAWGYSVYGALWFY